MIDLKYYLLQSKRTEISKDFSNKFGKSVQEIIKNVRLKMFHACELKDNVFGYNWPRFSTVKDIEKECKNQKLVCGICRDFTILTVALFRANGVPARSRCGFATYLTTSGGYEDHWIVEFWDKKIKDWVMVDVQKKLFNLETGKFINGAIAWQLYRKFQYNPNLFGFTGMQNQSTGVYYLVGNLIRDMKGLLKNEIMYIETFPIMEKGYKLKKSDLDLLDKISDLILTENIQALKSLDKKYFIESEKK